MPDAQTITNKTLVPLGVVVSAVLALLAVGFPLIKNMGAKEAQDAAIVTQLDKINVTLTKTAEKQHKTDVTTAQWQARIENKIEIIDISQKETQVNQNDILNRVIELEKSSIIVPMLSKENK